MYNTISHYSQEILSGTSVASVAAGMTIGQANEWLQAGAFIIAILSGGVVIWTKLRGHKHANRKDQ